MSYTGDSWSTPPPPLDPYAQETLETLEIWTTTTVGGVELIALPRLRKLYVHGKACSLLLKSPLAASQNFEVRSWCLSCWMDD